MGNSTSSALVNYEKIQQSKANNNVLIHIMEDDQKLMILGSLTAYTETTKVNDMISRNEYETEIMIYGRNDHDYDKLITKHKQLKSLGFKHVYIYLGGMFELLLLQDVYGFKEFPTTIVHGVKPDPIIFMPR